MQFKSMDFSLFFFSGDGATADPRKYQLLLESVKFADQHDFTAVWVPERHFHAVGGLYPNPSVVAAALAMVTERIELRAGSVILPLHNAARVAEEWAVVDNLSGGRVALAFGSGWQPNDFIFFPDRYDTRKEEMYRGIEIFKKLWRGEAAPFVSGSGEEIPIKVFPRPLSKTLPPIWISATREIETFRDAGRLGANILTALLYQNLGDTAEKIAAYRESLVQHGHTSGKVTLALHTFIGEDLDEVRETVREPLCNYLRSSISLMKNVTEKFGIDIEVDKLSSRDIDGVLAFAFERYFNNSALLGTVDSCSAMIERLRDVGVDEIACFIDFGPEPELVMSSMVHLDALRRRWQTPSQAVAATATAASVAEQAVQRSEKQKQALLKMKRERQHSHP
jgi:natural product biosynthesis luciferase-like monooxygenase protein